MPFRGPLLWLRDIVAAIADIRNFTTGMNALAFREDRRTLAAVERKLQVISEAATRLGDDAERLCPGMPWRNIRGIGNWLRHQHDHVDADSIWETVVRDLPPLEEAVIRAIDALDRQPES